MFSTLSLFFRQLSRLLFQITWRNRLEVGPTAFPGNPLPSVVVRTVIFQSVFVSRRLVPQELLVLGYRGERTGDRGIFSED